MTILRALWLRYLDWRLRDIDRALRAPGADHHRLLAQRAIVASARRNA